MPDRDGDINQPDTEPEFDKDAGPWQKLVTDAEKAFQVYQDKCDTIDKELANLERLAGVKRDREFQIFWANLEVLKPSIYASPPVPVVVPRFRNRKELAVKTSEILERAINTSFENENIDEVMKLIRDDLVTTGRGALWTRYETSQDADGQPQEKVAYDHVDRKDFLHDPARKWREVDWVARRSWLTRKQGLARFGDAFRTVELKERGAEDDDNYKGEKKAAVWEIWHKSKEAVVWVSPGVDEVLDIRPPFLDLEGFFPCPEPVYSTVQRRTLKPVPDFLFYKDQIEEINELTARISSLSESLRMKGFYAGGAQDVGDALEAAMKDMSNEAIMVPVSNFAAMGGASLKDSIIWLPVQEIAVTIRELLGLRRQLIDDVYQLTGLSDIMRGTTDPNETLGAQQLKSQFGSVRVRSKQDEMIRVGRDAARIAAEIMAENFQPATLLAMSQVDDVPAAQEIAAQIEQINQTLFEAAQTPEAKQLAQQQPEAAGQAVAQAEQQIQTLQNTVTVEAIMALLRSQRIRPFALDIETDSTIQPDEDAAKQRATEFVTAVGGFLAQSVPVVAQLPEAAPLAAEMLKFTAGQFRAGRELGGVIDDFAEKVKEQAQAPQQPSPEQMKMETDKQLAEAELALKAQEGQANREIEKLKIAAAAKPQKVITMPDSMREEVEIMMAQQQEALETIQRQQAEGLNAAVQSMAQAANIMAQAAAMLGAPKRVVFDEQNRPVGVETVVN